MPNRSVWIGADPTRGPDGMRHRSEILLAGGFPTRSAYESLQPWGLSTAIDLHRCDPDAIRDKKLIMQFTRELCDLLGVRRFGEPQVVRFGRDPRVYGYSMVQLIETSLVSAHFAEDTNAAYLDVFSCAWYDAEAAAAFAQKYLRAGRVEVHTCVRG